MALHDIRPKIILVDASGQHTRFLAPAFTRYPAVPFDSTGLASTRDVIRELGLTSGTGHLSVGDYPTGVISDDELIAEDNPQNRDRLSEAGWFKKP